MSARRRNGFIVNQTSRLHSAMATSTHNRVLHAGSATKNLNDNPLKFKTNRIDFGPSIFGFLFDFCSVLVAQCVLYIIHSWGRPLF